MRRARLSCAHVRDNGPLSRCGRLVRCAGQGRFTVPLPGAVRTVVPLCQGGGEVGHGGGQGEQVAGDGGEGGQKLH